MRDFDVSDSALMLVFDTGDELVESLRKFAAARHIDSAQLAAIGGFQRATIAYWNPQTRQYEDIPVHEQVEVVSLLGNVSRIGDNFKVHAHVLLGRRDGSTIGGHLKSGVVLPTVEMHLSLFRTALIRKRDDATGLDLL